jgi:paraquat-inducible protein A
MNAYPRTHDIGVIGCPVCGLVLELAGDEERPSCPRCHSPLCRRHPHSLIRTWLLLFAALAAYVPANLLPIIDIQVLGQGDQRLTIMGGVFGLWSDGACDMAIVVFIASVMLPCAKFTVLAWLLISVQHHSPFARRHRDKLHRFLELIGYWSMLDVLVVAILGSLVQFQALGEIQPEAGIFLFGASVILMILASHGFDSRLIWDGEQMPVWHHSRDVSKGQTEA